MAGQLVGMQLPCCTSTLRASRASPSALKPSARQLLRLQPQTLRTQAALATEAPPAAKNGTKKEGPIIMNGHVLHSISHNQLELVNSLAGFVEEEILPILKPVDKCWQPTDYLPSSDGDDFIDEVRELRKRTDCLPDSYFVVLVGDMITEEALPTYMAMLNTLDGVRDETGAAPTPWGRWTREWTAEENRHGDLMNKYCYLSGRVNMKAVEVTIQNLIGSGMDPKTDNNPYLGFIYTSFQERATKISHGNTARHAKDYGDEVLGKICGAIASDESRHEIAYTKIAEKFFEKDPSGAMLAFEDMMRKQIVMPAHLMDDNQHSQLTGRNLFKDFSTVAEFTETYTAYDYANIMEHLVKRWDIEHLEGLTPEAQKAQDYVCRLPPRVRKLYERTLAQKAKGAKFSTPFSWIFGREIVV